MKNITKLKIIIPINTAIQRKTIHPTLCLGQSLSQVVAGCLVGSIPLFF